MSITKLFLMKIPAPHKILIIFSCIAILSACAPVTEHLSREHSSRRTVSIEKSRDFDPVLSGTYPPEENSTEQEERLQDDVEPEPERTKDQELQELKLLGEWEKGVPAVEVMDEEVTYDFPVTINRHVQYYLDFFTGKNRDNFGTWLSRSGRYLPMIHEQLREAGLPEDLAYLAMIESGFNERAYSRARAVGVWQFIKGTGKNYGLKIDTYVDERRDPVKSTKAAVSYLKDLYDEFGSWYLAVAAYNAGEGKIRRAIKKYNTTDFWEIAQGKYLKLETKRYVPKLIAAIIIAKEPDKYGFDITYEEPLAFETVDVPRWTALKAVALACDLEPSELKRYNNELRKEFTPPDRGAYSFKVPMGKKEQVEKNLPRIQAVVSTGFKTHTVENGETLDGICRKYGLTKTIVLKSNDLRSSGLKTGQRLRIPYQTIKYEMLPEGRVAKGYLKAEAGEGNFVLHKILPGETVYELSRRYNIPIHLIAAWNDLSDIRRIRAGQKLVFYVQNGEDRAADFGAVTDSVKQINPVSIKEAAGEEGKSPKNRFELAALRKDLHNDDSGRYYIVKKGDSLWDIARQFELDSKELKQLNGLVSNVIYPGDQILVATAQRAKNKPVKIDLAETQHLETFSGKAEFYYQVRSGDSLWNIARKYKVSPDEIKTWNNLRNNLIHPGNKLLLKVADTGKSRTDTFYQVRSGDSLWTIARRHNISPEAIKRWNNLKDNTIFPGNRLVLKLASDG
ncbi:MAG: LysM peptidoglycan-binding domain-containing protein [Deltaproteobacteria bacterium]|jgi:membrane-bound lytic murein transglycosylase D|nr:LysM peptidoglycan-binding domain-containing protein [Deltaproteobacteria bacterium]